GSQDVVLGWPVPAPLGRGDRSATRGGDSPGQDARATNRTGVTGPFAASQRASLGEVIGRARLRPSLVERGWEGNPPFSKPWRRLGRSLALPKFLRRRVDSEGLSARWLPVPSGGT